MQARVAILMGSASDMPVMEQAARILDQLEIPFEINALSAHRTPEDVAGYSAGCMGRGIGVVIAGAGGAAHLPGVVAASFQGPVIGVPCRSSISLDGWDAVLSILQMPPGIPVATVGLDAAKNAGILAAQILACGDAPLQKRVNAFKEGLKDKVRQANESLSSYTFKYRVATPAK